jgi:hypothetical protein
MSDTNEPVAWAVTPKGKREEIDCDFVYPSAATAGDVALDFGVVVPLYRSPTLTDEEREVLLAIEADAAYRATWRTGRVVRGLLDRTK